MDFGDLVASAERRAERNLKHILDAGQSLLGKTGGGGQDAKVRKK